MKLLTFGLLLAGLLTSRLVRAQSDTLRFIHPVEVMPELPGGGGGAAIVAAVQARLVYPAAAVRAHVVGRVFVGFTITAEGLVTDVELRKGFRADCDAAALEAVQRLPRFKPGEQLGRPVPCRYTLPVRFNWHKANQRPSKQPFPPRNSTP